MARNGVGFASTGLGCPSTGLEFALTGIASRDCEGEMVWRARRAGGMGDPSELVKVSLYRGRGQSWIPKESKACAYDLEIGPVI